jgi:hypothetical protein
MERKTHLVAFRHGRPPADHALCVTKKHGVDCTILPFSPGNTPDRWKHGDLGAFLRARKPMLTQDQQNSPPKKATATARAKGTAVHVSFASNHLKLRLLPTVISITPDDAMALSIELHKASIDARVFGYREGHCALPLAQTHTQPSTSPARHSTAKVTTMPMEFKFSRPLSPKELEMVREQIESLDDVTTIDDEVRGIVERNWPHLVSKLPPAGKQRDSAAVEAYEIPEPDSLGG